MVVNICSEKIYRLACALGSQKVYSVGVNIKVLVRDVKANPFVTYLYSMHAETIFRVS